MSRKYIPLDSNFLDDPKIIKLLMSHGSEGITVWISVLCYLRESEVSRYAKAGLADAIAYRLRLDPSCVESILQTALLSGLLQEDDGWLYSSAFDSRMELMNKGNTKRSETMRQRWEEKRANSKQVEPEVKQDNALDQIADVSKMIEPEPKRPRIDHSADVKAVFDHWNSKKIMVHREVNPTLREAIVKAVTKYTLHGVLRSIDFYEKSLADVNNPMTYKWTLKDFIKRSNGLDCYYDKAVNVIAESDVRNEAQKKLKSEQAEREKADREKAEQMLSYNWMDFDQFGDLLRHLWGFPDEASRNKWKACLPIPLSELIDNSGMSPMILLKSGVPLRLQKQFEEMK